MKTGTSNRLVTNLVGRKVKLLSDEQAKEEARAEGKDDELVAMITAGTWIPALNDPGWKRLSGVLGEIVAVHLSADSNPVYIVDFQGELIRTPSHFFRLVPLPNPPPPSLQLS